MVASVEVRPSVMRWAIEASGKDLEDVRLKLNKIPIHLNESTLLTMTQIKKLSQELKVPFGYFMLSEPPVEKVELLKYRTINNEAHQTASRELIDTIKDMQKKQMFMKEVLLEDDFSEIELVGSLQLNTDIVTAANSIRKVLDIDDKWNFKNKNAFNALKKAVSKAGILVMQNGIVGNQTKRKLDVKEFRAFVMIDPYAPLIFLNTNDSDRGKLFSLCHELVHIGLGKDEIYNATQIIDNSKEERYCNEVAAELLLSEKDIKKQLNDIQQNEKDFVERTAYHYSISCQ